MRNEHGLHARPGMALVSVIKQFDSAVTVTNLDDSDKPANGRSLMKSSGARRQNTLPPEGNDAEQALQAIGEAIASPIAGMERHEQMHSIDYAKSGLRFGGFIRELSEAKSTWYKPLGYMPRAKGLMLPRL